MTTQAPPALQVEGVVKRYGEVVANDEVGLQVRPGDVVGLLGHNGAGKTTLVSQIVGLLRPDAGRIAVAGVDAVAHPEIARRLVALQTQTPVPIDGLTPRAAIEIAGRLRGLSRRDARAAAVRLADELDIGEWLDRRAAMGGGVSGGVRRLTAFAMAAVAPTPLIVLDEPTNDVDAVRRRLLWQAVRRLGDGGAGVLLVTHNVFEAERVVDELVVLDHGRVLAAGTPAQLHGAQAELRLELTLDPARAAVGAGRNASPDPTGEVPAPFPLARRITAGRRVLLAIAPADAVTAVEWAEDLRRTNRIESYALTPVTIEDAYLSLTTPEGAPEEVPAHV